MASPLESPITADAPPLVSPTTANSLSGSIGLRITVDLSESANSGGTQDDFIVNRLLADDEPEDELLAADEIRDDQGKQKPEVHFVDNTGFLSGEASKLKAGVIVTRDKKYINRNATAFDLGIDRNSTEWRQRRANRGERFGMGAIDDEPMVTAITVQDEDFDISALYESVGLTPEVLTAEASNLRLAVIHVRGLDEMSTDDVLKHFGAFVPSYLEWIDDTSCNVVWQDEVSAARALCSLSKVIEEPEPSENKEEEQAEVAAATSQMDTEMQDQPIASESDDKIVVDAAKGDETAATAAESTKALAESSGEESTEETLKALGVGKMYADREPGETSSASEDDEFAASGPKQRKKSDGEAAVNVQGSVKGLKWRVGSWKGRNSKERKLFMRFATAFDKKQSGANKFSKYYEKYGNPNYNNMPGLISNSMRRRLAGTKRHQQLEEARAALKALGGGHRDTDAAMSELAAMGAGTAVGEEEDDEDALEPIAATDKTDLRSSGWLGRPQRGAGYTGRLMRFDASGGVDRPSSPEPERPVRGRVGSSEGRCPPPSPRGRHSNHRTTESGEEWVSSDDDDEDKEYSTDEDDPINELLSAIPVRGRGSTRAKLYADDEERKRARRGSDRSSKMRSDNMYRSSRSRSRSPLASTWVKPPSKSSFDNRDDRDDRQHRRSLHDRLGPQVNPSDNKSSRSSKSRNERERERERDRDRDRYRSNRRREDIRSRLG